MKHCIKFWIVFLFIDNLEIFTDSNKTSILEMGHNYYYYSFWFHHSFNYTQFYSFPWYLVSFVVTFRFKTSSTANKSNKCPWKTFIYLMSFCFVRFFVLFLIRNIFFSAKTNVHNFLFLTCRILHTSFLNFSLIL